MPLICIYKVSISLSSDDTMMSLQLLVCAVGWFGLVAAQNLFGKFIQLGNGIYTYFYFIWIVAMWLIYSQTEIPLISEYKWSFPLLIS